MSLDNNTKAQLDALVNKFDERIERAIDKRECEAKKGLFSQNNKGGRLLTKQDIEGMKNVFKGNTNAYSFEVKASDITTGSGSGSYIIEDLAGNKSSQRVYLDLFQLFPQYSADGGSVRWVTENGLGDNNIAIVSEGSASTQSDTQLKEVKVSIETLRSFYTMSQELLEDTQNAESLLRTRFFQQMITKQNNELIQGSGDINSLNANNVVCPTDSNLLFYQSVDNAQSHDCLSAVIAQMANDGYMVDNIIISSKQMFELQFVKDANNNYIQNDLQVVSPNYARFKGVNIWATEVLSGDIGFAFDSQKYGVLCRKQTYDMKLTQEGKDALVNNVAYLGIQSRFNLAILNTSSCMKFDISDLKTALETP
jgi:HK97 family phage major capsid protein